MLFPIQSLAAIGRFFIGLLATVGRVTYFAITIILRGLLPPYYPGRFLSEFFEIGWNSLPVVALTAVFTGSALAQQVYSAASRFSAQSTVPAAVVIGMVRELGPVLVGLMVVGRVTSAIAAEIGAMRVTEQIDAMETLHTDPYRYLLAPRLYAAVIALPFLVMLANIIGIFGGYLLSIGKLGFNPENYLKVTRNFLKAEDIHMALVKAAVFGFLMALLGCYNGFFARGGAVGVGRATTRAVVSAFIMILFSNLMITLFFFG
ncbi:ABC transporter permease [Zymomonas mobilis subsp. pomaceae]|nr:ABC transporter permease [Zymomonas mobilis subsp. pomaceae]